MARTSKIDRKAKKRILEKAFALLEEKQSSIKHLLAVVPLEELKTLLKKTLKYNNSSEEVIVSLYEKIPIAHISNYKALFKGEVRRTLVGVLLNQMDIKTSLDFLQERITQCCPLIAKLMPPTFMKEIENVYREAKRKWDTVADYKGDSEDLRQKAFIFADSFLSLHLYPLLVIFYSPYREVDIFVDLVLEAMNGD
jgi:hypothetical protein